ncbi:MAG: hypothetical protein IT379_14760 [Deltaproteobacteria bacterium]|nr:hypothetical protein [Deltaproteobacteria bacterium]
MTTPNNKKRGRPPKKGAARSTSWRSIVLEVLDAAGPGELTLAQIYASVADHPAAQERATTNRHVPAKVRQVLQRLRDQRKATCVRPGVWQVGSPTSS